MPDKWGKTMTEKMLDRMWNAIFGSNDWKGILVRLGRIEIQIYGIYFMLIGVNTMLWSKPHKDIVEFSKTFE